MNTFYYKSEYRLNDGCEDIVYYSQSTNDIVHVSKEQFLAENPNLTGEDFDYYKHWSDEDLRELYQHDRAEGRRHCPLREELACEQQALMESKWLELCDMALDLASVLSQAQIRRLMLYSVYGFTTTEIAEREGCAQQVISHSIIKARRKLQKYFSRGV